LEHILVCSVKVLRSMDQHGLSYDSRNEPKFSVQISDLLSVFVKSKILSYTYPKIMKFYMGVFDS